MTTNNPSNPIESNNTAEPPNRDSKHDFFELVSGSQKSFFNHGQEVGYKRGYEEGYQQGYRDGYQNGVCWHPDPSKRT